MIAMTNQKKVVDSMDILNTTRFHDIYSDKPSHVNGTVVQEAGKHGSGEMHCFQIAPGTQITYNDLSIDSCFRPIRFENDFLQINHCLVGCYECALRGGSVRFVGEV